MLLYVNWDGFSAHWYRLARQTAPGTPNLDRLIAGGAVLESHRCGIPAITNPMQQTLVSGAWPADTGNCYVRFDREARCARPTGRVNRCENLVECARRQGRRCALIHGWYFENRGCEAGCEEAPYISGDWPNFPLRVRALMDYLHGRPVPSGGGTVRMRRRPDFLAIYADDIDTVCHNGKRLPYAGMRRARTLDEWTANLTAAVQCMDEALGELLTLEDVTIALAADHGGMPYAMAMNGVSVEDAAAPRETALMEALARAGITPYRISRLGERVPEQAGGAILIQETQAMLYGLGALDEPALNRARAQVLALPFMACCLMPREQHALGAPEDFCDLYMPTRAPWYLGPAVEDPYGCGSHAAVGDSVMEVFCAFHGPGVRRGVRVTRSTDLTDFAPTVCRLMGMERPKNSTGRVLEEILLP